MLSGVSPGDGPAAGFLLLKLYDKGEMFDGDG